MKRMVIRAIKELCSLEWAAAVAAHAVFAAADNTPGGLIDRFYEDKVP